MKITILILLLFTLPISTEEKTNNFENGIFGIPWATPMDQVKEILNKQDINYEYGKKFNTIRIKSENFNTTLWFYKEIFERFTRNTSFKDPTNRGYSYWKNYLKHGTTEIFPNSKNVSGYFSVSSSNLSGSGDETKTFISVSLSVSSRYVDSIRKKDLEEERVKRQKKMDDVTSLLLQK
jgi:hypothetical protein